VVRLDLLVGDNSLLELAVAGEILKFFKMGENDTLLELAVPEEVGELFTNIIIIYD
jgi:hypothetical protein